jgi:bla regulator protein blaR1
VVMIWMLSVVLVTALVGLAALLLDRVAAAVGAPRRWIWAGAYLTSAAIVAIPAPSLDLLPALLLGLSGGSAMGAAAGEGASPPLIAELVAVASSAASPALPLDRVLLLLWAGLAAWFGGRWVHAWFLTGRAARRWSRVALPEGEVFVSESTGPALVGIARPRIVVPRWVLQLPPGDRTLVLAHEEEHRRAHDPLLVLFATIVTAALPWNVPLWACLRRLREAVELDCDARVVRNFPHARRSYGSLLVRVASGPAAAGLAFAPFAPRTRDLERRIEMITQRFTRRSPLSLAILSGGALLLLVSACLVPGSDRAEETPTDPTSIEQAAPPEVSEAERERAALAEAPAFTPFEIRPELLNVNDVMAALEQNYPRDLRDAGIGGVAVVQMFIDENGEMQNALVFESSGHQSLDQAALAVVREMDFSPAQNRGESVPVWIQQAVTFQTR